MLQKTIIVLNTLQKKGLIENYAIGGAMAILFYMEPILTYDMDVFVFLPKDHKPLTPLSGIYYYLTQECSYPVDREHIVIEGIPVQFLPAHNHLIEEAIMHAKIFEEGGEKVSVITLEYLLAIMVQTGRPKDRARFQQVLEEVTINTVLLEEILDQYALSKAWLNL